MTTITAHRGEILHLLDDPASAGDEAAQYLPDGVLLVKDGHIEAVGPAETLLAGLPAGTEITEHPNGLMVPGFIDTHVHYPQTEMVAAFGEQLLEWLQTYTFPTESKFEDVEYARSVADRFLTELLRNGTTTALVFGTVHPQSVDALFSEAQRRNLRMICGKVMMDRNAPETLCDTPESSYRDSKALIERWHGNGRQLYAVTPRFAPTSSDEQLAMAGKLLEEYPDVYMHTHLSENRNECAWVQELFPESRHYLDVYDRFGLLRERSVFAHSIHLCDEEWQRLGETGSAIAFCPTSNLFLGSGLFRLDEAERHQVRVGLGTDVGAGTSFSLLATANEAYKVMQLQGRKLSPLKSLYLATLGGARALHLEDRLGNFTPGKEADFVVLDYHATPYLQFRTERCRTLEERLFVFNMLGDDRAVRATYAAGRPVHVRQEHIAPAAATQRQQQELEM